MSPVLVIKGFVTSKSHNNNRGSSICFISKNRKKDGKEKITEVSKFSAPNIAFLAF